MGKYNTNHCTAAEIEQDVHYSYLTRVVRVFRLIFLLVNTCMIGVPPGRCVRKNLSPRTPSTSYEVLRKNVFMIRILAWAIVVVADCVSFVCIHARSVSQFVVHATAAVFAILLHIFRVACTSSNCRCCFSH